MTEAQVLQTIQNFLSTNPSGLVDSVKRMIGRAVEDLEVEMPKQKVMNMLADALSKEELDDIRADIQAKSEKQRETRDAPTTQAHERPFLNILIADYAEWAETIEGAKAAKSEKMKRSVAEIAVKKGLPEGVLAMEMGKYGIYDGGKIGRRTRSRRSCRKQTKRRRCRSMTFSKRR
jgi:hypothetical protein